MAGQRVELGLGVWGLPATVWGIGGGPAQGRGSELVTLGKSTQSCEPGCQGPWRGGWNFPDGMVGVVCAQRCPWLCLCPERPQSREGSWARASPVRTLPPVDWDGGWELQP